MLRYVAHCTAERIHAGICGALHCQVNTCWDIALHCWENTCRNMQRIARLVEYMLGYVAHCTIGRIHAGISHCTTGKIHAKICGALHGWENTCQDVWRIALLEEYILEYVSHCTARRIHARICGALHCWENICQDMGRIALLGNEHRECETCSCI